MYRNPDILWLNSNPYLRRFNIPAIKQLSTQVNIGHWEYRQTEDEGTSIDQAVELLNQYLDLLNKPIHLVGHSTCGLLGLHYAHRYPQKIKSLTILGVGTNSTLDWLSYYYLWRNNWDCSQDIVLAHTAKYLFGSHSYYYRKALVKIIEKAVSFSLSRHSLYKKYSYLEVPNVDCPLMVIGSIEDQIVPWNEIEKWQPRLKPEDALWQFPTGDHFFHYLQPQLMAEKLLEFWSAKETVKLSINCNK